MATPAMQMAAPATSVEATGSCRKTTPAVTAKTICNSAKGAIEHREISQNHKAPAGNSAEKDGVAKG